MPASTLLALRQLQYSIVSICLYFIGLMYFIVPPNSQTLLERFDISTKFIWVPIMYVVIMTYIWIGLSWIFSILIEVL